jgi:hypothetical protein
VDLDLVLVAAHDVVCVWRVMARVFCVDPIVISMKFVRMMCERLMFDERKEWLKKTSTLLIYAHVKYGLEATRSVRASSGRVYNDDCDAGLSSLTLDVTHQSPRDPPALSRVSPGPAKSVGQRQAQTDDLARPRGCHRLPGTPEVSWTKSIIIVSS